MGRHLFVLLFVLLSILVPSLSTAQTVSLQNASDSLNQIKPHLQFNNSSLGGTIPLSQLSLRYYISDANGVNQQLFCDYAQVGCQNLTLKMVKTSDGKSTAYVEIGFTSAAGQLLPGGSSGQIQIRIARSDWSNYNQVSDYSYLAPANNFAVTLAIPLLNSGVLLAGQLPSGSVAAAAPVTTPVAVPIAAPVTLPVVPMPTTPVVVVPTSATGCAAVIKATSQWNGGMVAIITVSSSSVLTGWTVGLSLPAPNSVSSLWSAQNSGTSGNVLIRNANYNGAVSSSSPVSFGLVLNGPASVDQLQSMLTCAPDGAAAVVTTPVSVTVPIPVPVPVTSTPAPTTLPIATAVSAKNYSGLKVSNGMSGSPGHIVNAAGQIVQLHGVNKSGSEYACIQGFGFFDGPTDQNSVNLMKNWNINAVRLPLNEDCWLQINGANPTYSGANYQNAIAAYVKLLTDNGLIVILDLHWAAPGSQRATSQLAMADADHAPTFWSQVATAYAGNGSVIFDLFNEPFITDWSCWVKGGYCANDYNGQPYNVAGMATLLQAVRRTGAQNVVMLGGLAYSNNLSQWLASVQSIADLPTPLNGISLANVAASYHQYDFNSNTSGCPGMYSGYAPTSCFSGSQTALNAGITSVLAGGFPVVMGEVGISANSAQSAAPFTAVQVSGLQNWLGDLLSFMDTNQQGYMAWAWNTAGTPYLLQDYGNATPSVYFGVTYKAHLANR